MAPLTHQLYLTLYPEVLTNAKTIQTNSLGVAYLHGTKEKPFYENGGEYVFFPNGPGADAQEIKPKRGQAILMDGGRMIHGVARTAPGYDVAAIDKDFFNRLEYQGNNTWYLLSDKELIDVFKTEELRMTFVWRGLCFHDEAEKTKFEKHLENKVSSQFNPFFS